MASLLAVAAVLLAAPAPEGGGGQDGSNFTCVVTTTDDTGVGTLRWCIEQANVFGCTIEHYEDIRAEDDLYLSGACTMRALFEGKWVYYMKTADGKVVYKGAPHRSVFDSWGYYYLYFDQSCDGGNSNPRWVISSRKPSKTKTQNLDGTGAGQYDNCSHKAYIKSMSATVPYGESTWNYRCNTSTPGGMTRVNISVLQTKSMTCGKSFSRVITFDLPILEDGELPSIKLLSELPDIAVTMTIDGRSSANSVGVVLDGSKISHYMYGTGLTLQANNIEIHGMGIHNFYDRGIRVGGTNARISGEIRNIVYYGIMIDSSASNTFVGDVLRAPTVIAGCQQSAIRCYGSVKTLLHWCLSTRGQ
jgi:hypothetical protein